MARLGKGARKAQGLLAAPTVTTEQAKQLEALRDRKMLQCALCKYCGITRQNYFNSNIVKALLHAGIDRFFGQFISLRDDQFSEPQYKQGGAWYPLSVSEVATIHCLKAAWHARSAELGE